MGDDERLHRKDPERTAPIRSLADYLARTNTRTRDDASSNGTCSDGTAHANASSGHDDGVGLAYRVIDKHINDGRRSAEALNGQPYNSRATTDRVQEVIERTIRYSTELLPLWIEALTTAIRVDPPRMPSPMPSSFGASPPPIWDGNGHEASSASSEGSTAIAIEMISTQPVTVSIDLRENSERMPLVTLGLRALERDKPELSEIEIASNGESGIKLRIRVPASHPAGTYSGVIVNQETGESRGTLTVRVSDT